MTGASGAMDGDGRTDRMVKSVPWNGASDPVLNNYTNFKGAPHGVD